MLGLHIAGRKCQMTTLKQIRQLAWDHEFSVADEELQRFDGWERARRAAVMARRQSSARASCVPSPVRVIAERPATVIAPGVPDLSRHGQRRLQQRGITMDQVLTVIGFGKEERAHGASRYLLDKHSRALLAVEMPTALRRLHTLDIHVVVSDQGTLITAAHRTRRLRRQ